MGERERDVKEFAKELELAAKEFFVGEASETKQGFKILLCDGKEFEIEVK